MRSRTKLFAVALATVALTGCGINGGDDDSRALRTAGDLPSGPAQPVRTAGDVQDFPVILGEPYRIGGTVFAPFDKMSFDEVGYAAVIPPNMEGQATVNGEQISAQSYMGAHRTLPVPSYVEVTSLENGRTILVRINDRGPMLVDRNIALSVAAAEQLGLSGDGTSAVRVRRVNPPEQERAIVRAGGKAASRLETPVGLRAALKAKLPSAPAPLGNAVALQPIAPPASSSQPSVVRSVEVPAAQLPPARVTPPEGGTVTPDRFIIEQAGAPQAAPRRAGTSFLLPAAEADQTVKGGFVIQVGAFADSTKAAAVAQATGAQIVTDGTFYRVRTNPYKTAAAARAALPAIQAKGYAEARVVVNDRQ